MDIMSIFKSKLLITTFRFQTVSGGYIRSRHSHATNLSLPSSHVFLRSVLAFLASCHLSRLLLLIIVGVCDPRVDVGIDNVEILVHRNMYCRISCWEMSVSSEKQVEYGRVPSSSTGIAAAKAAVTSAKITENDRMMAK